MKRIFLIDDDIDDREMFQVALNALDIEINYTEAKDGQEALEMIESNDYRIPDFIFVDLNMPRMNGLEFIIRMKQFPQYRDVPTYVYTTSASASQKINCIAAGATGYIVKKYNHRDLTSELKPLIKGSIPAAS